MKTSRILIACLALSLTTLTVASAIEVSISVPIDGSVVSGVVEIAGTSDLPATGRVAVSIDDGPFEPAQGIETWNFTWDTSQVGDGTHQMTARARECLSCPPAFEQITVEVANHGLSVSFTSPAEGEVVVDTLVVLGNSTGATEVALSVDGATYRVANGLAPWSIVFEPGALMPGPHTLTARATDDLGNEAFAERSITVGDPPPGLHEFTYASSLDGEPIGGVYYLPADYDPTLGPVGLVMHLHGGGGLGSISESMQEALDAKGWIGIAPDGRAWGLHDPSDPDSCPWVTSAAYVDHPDPDVGPGEQDMLDAVTWAQSAFDIDPDRLYLTGFSMGGRGAYGIGLRNPDLFAAIAPMGPAVDMYEVFVRRPEPAACKEGMVGGQPGDSPLVDTFYSITSGRFLIENAFNLPVFHAHGTEDTVANNTPAGAPFLHGWHMTTDDRWSDCHDDLCFGHTPTLDELRQHHASDPAAYDWAYFFSAVGHVTDSRWLLGAEVQAGDFGTEDPQSPGRILGIYDFFESRPRIASPDAVVFKTYTDQHRRSFWCELLITRPWQDLPGAVRARRDLQANALELELVRAAEVMIDLDLAQLSLRGHETFTVNLEPLDEPAFDPALQADGEGLTPTLRLQAILGEAQGVTVLQDGVPLPASLVMWNASEVAIGPLELEAPTTLQIQVRGADAIFGDSFETGDFSAWSLWVDN